MRLLRRGLAAAFVGLVLVLTVLCGPAGAAPTGVIPRPKPHVETVTDKVVGIGLTVASFTPWGRAAMAARWALGAVTAIQAGESVLSLINGRGDAGDEGTESYPGSAEGDNPDRLGRPTTSTNNMRCYNQPSVGSAREYAVPSNQAGGGSTMAVSFAVSYLPNQAVLDTFAGQPTNLCKDDPDGSGPRGVTNKTSVEGVYYCMTAAGDVMVNSAGSPNPGLPTATTWANYLYDNSGGYNFGVGSYCPAGGAVAFLRYWASSSGGYYAPGVGTYVRPGFDPDRLIGRSVEVDCVNLSTGAVQTVSAGYTPDPGLSPDATVNIPGCPAGMVPSEIRTYESLPGHDGKTLINRDTVDHTKIGQQYPTCAGVGCELEVYVDGNKCTVGADNCWNWWKTAQENPSRVTCKWGPYSVPTAECERNRWVYRTGHTTTDPDTGERTAADPQTGLPDPNAGPGVDTDPVPDNRPAPIPDPAAPPGTGTDPNSPDPAPDPDGDTSNCWKAAISWNPVDWVMVPVQCALTWAFVPKTDAMTKAFDDVGDSFARTGVGRWFGFFGTLVGSTGGGGEGSCLGPAWNLSATQVTSAVTLHPFAACSSPQSVIAAVVKIGLTVVVWLGAGIVCLRLLGASMGLNLNGVGGRDGDA